MTKLSDYLKISDAADYLGVSPNTLRNWVNAGKVAAVRHPVNQYRLFRLRDLQSLLDGLSPQGKRARK
ncbi:MAG: helix-turn-helix domain-containing protein [Pirellulales bacterium]